MIFKTILHPTDFSPASEYAFQMACELARAGDGKVIALHIASPPPPSVVPFHGEGILPEQHQQLMDSLRRDLERLEPNPPDVALENRLLEVEGHPAPAILEVAEAEGVDLIVMGTKGRTALTRLLMGSVTQQVLRMAPCPVITVKIPEPQTGTAGMLTETTATR